MDAKEEVLQLKKLAGIEKMVALLEEIAFNTSGKMIERKDYLERIYARSKSSATEVHGGVRTQPAAHGGQVSQHDAAAVSRLRSDPSQRSPETKKS